MLRHPFPNPNDDDYRSEARARLGEGNTEAREPRARFAPGVPEFSLILGSWPYGGVSGGWGALQPAHEQQQHLCRGMGVPYGSPNNRTL